MIYLASPYSHPSSFEREKRFRAVCHAAATLFGRGIHVFSPIVHSHPLAILPGHDLPGDWAFWRSFDERMIGMCDELWVLKIDGWMDSVGVSAEIQIAAEMDKPVRHVSLDELTTIEPGRQEEGITR